ncbi:MAG: VanZ family protein [Bacteroidaceae bacterium]|nr:VanZ family protein [Bacteroidaceae bacterium]
MERKFIRKYPLSLFTACVIICLSLFPIPEIPQAEDVPFIDKWTHMVMYGSFCLIIWFEYLRNHKTINTVRITLFGYLCPITMSGLLELAQEYLTTCRSGEWLDLLANSTGTTIAYLIGWAFRRKN